MAGFGLGDKWFVRSGVVSVMAQGIVILDDHRLLFAVEVGKGEAGVTGKPETLRAAIIVAIPFGLDQPEDGLTEIARPNLLILINVG